MQLQEPLSTSVHVAQIHTPCPVLRFNIHVADEGGNEYRYEAPFKNSWDATDDAMVRFQNATFIHARPQT
jgi:hypothetical protein